MRNLFTLTRVLIKNTSFGFEGKKKLSTILFTLLICFSFIPLLYSIYEVFMTGFSITNMLQQNISLFTIAMQLCSLIVFTFGIFMIPSVYYFGEDIETLLRLPLKPEEILTSKFILCIIYEYLFLFLIMGPMIAAYFMTTGFSFLTLILFFIIALLIPVYPLILCSVIVMCLMRFTPFFKNRDRFQLIGGFVGVLLALGLSYGINQIMEPQSQSELIYMFINGDDTISNLFTCLFPTIIFGSKAIVQHDLLSLFLFVCTQFITFILFILLARNLYFKGVIGINQTSTKKTKVKNISHTVNHPYISYLKKEIITLVKTPTYALNCVGMVVIFPISLIIGFYSGSDGADFSFFANFHFEQLEGLMIIIGLCCGLLFASFNQTSSTALSREGRNYIFMKYIPISYKIQFLAKVSCGILFSLFMLLITFISIYFIFPYLPIHYNVLILLSAILSMIWFNFIALMIDFLHPKLIWNNEAEAVKQNWFSSLVMLLALAISAILILLIVFVDAKWWIYIALGMILFIAITFALIYYNLERFCNYCMNKINI